MTKNLLFASVILLITSCNSNTKTDEVVADPTVENTITLEFASKNPNTVNQGTGVMENEMLHLSLANNSKSDFVGQTLTLNNTVEGAINFTYRNDSVFCNAPTSLMLMSMPPKPGVRPAMITADSNFYVTPMSLLKFETVNIMFVGLGE
jgi:hypothetical protein